MLTYTTKSALNMICGLLNLFSSEFHLTRLSFWLRNSFNSCTLLKRLSFLQAPHLVWILKTSHSATTCFMLSKSKWNLLPKVNAKRLLACDKILPLLNLTFIVIARLNKAISARSQSFFLYSEPIYRMSKYYRDEMESREVCYSSADMVSRNCFHTVCLTQLYWDVRSFLHLELS